MFFHSLKYKFLCLVRDKSLMFWCFAFPLLLGTMFSFAFGSINESDSFSAIPVAVVREEAAQETAEETMLFDGIKMLFDSLSAEGEQQLFTVSYTSRDEALDLLSRKEICGIFTIRVADGRIAGRAADALLTLTVSSEMNSDPVSQSILNAFTQQFHMQYLTILDIAVSHPEKLGAVVEKMTEQADYIAEEALGADTLDSSLTYFFNLIAMTCLYAAIAGSTIAIDHQANLSALGARRSISSGHRLPALLGDLTALLLFEFITVLTALVYFITVLGVDFGTRLDGVMLTSLCGCLTGISLGFLVGCIGRFGSDTKFGILMAVIMTSVFLSGLMVGNMRILVEQFCPLLNRINPAALISDALYALVVYPSGERFFMNLAGLLALSAVFFLAGFVFVRRKKYAAL